MDARLKHILPPIVDAYLTYIQSTKSQRLSEHLDLETASCTLLYTLCKVRGYKVILGFLNNEPRYLEHILLRAEATVSADQEQKPEWQVSYVLLLWLSHLLLTPFDLASISNRVVHGTNPRVPSNLPPVASRILHIGMRYLPTSTKAQEAAALLLVRLARRPDVQKLDLGDYITNRMLDSLQNDSSDVSLTIYERLGPLRLLSGIAASSELDHLVPRIYEACQRLSESSETFFSTNAVAKKLITKIFRDVAILSIRSPNAKGPLLRFFETASVLEDAIDYLLRSLADRDTPVRFAAAKAISIIVLELDAEMREEVIQAVLDIFKEDIPRSSSQKLDFRTADSLKWHGLTLCLAHVLFKRSASPGQLADIVRALLSALQFEQRTATGSNVGTNVRDAANFGIWSLSRRYTTDELLSVAATAAPTITVRSDGPSIIQHLAIELVLSACLDPAGNVRRGSSAALQELIGRHPNQVKQGIALVQTVDYQAVGLRRRAMVDVAIRATQLDSSYFRPVLRALLEWRGLGSADVPSREAAALALAKLTEQGEELAATVAREVSRIASSVPAREHELLHGFALTVANILAKIDGLGYGVRLLEPSSEAMKSLFPTLLKNLNTSTDDFSSKMLRSELPSAIAKALAAYCSFETKRLDIQSDDAGSTVNLDVIETLAQRLFTRGEETTRESIPPLSRSLLALKRKVGDTLGCLGSQNLVKQVAIDSAKSTLHGAGRSMALGSLASVYGDGLRGSKAAEIITTLGSLTEAMAVDWRIIGIRALQLAVEGGAPAQEIEGSILQSIVSAVHRGLNDYTIDERGDVGSLVRLQAIACTSRIFEKCFSSKFNLNEEPLRIVQADILRLSLEKLDRVRLAAGQCQSQHLSKHSTILDIAAVSSYEYFAVQLSPLAHPAEPDWKQQALLEGAISATGISSEQLLQASRLALAMALSSTNDEQLVRLLTLYTTILKTSLANITSPLTTPALTLLAFLLDMRIPQRLATRPFKWLALLSAVQKSHHKSNDIPKIAAAVSVYRGLAEVAVIRMEVLKKLLSMLRTNPYPRVRMGVAETLLMVVGGEGGRRMLRGRDWMGDRKANESAVKDLEGMLLGKG